MLQHIKKLLVHNALLIAILVTVAIAILSLTSVPKLNLGFNFKSSDKFLHILAYFVLSSIWYFSLKEKIKKPSFKYTLIVCMIIYGIILELLQGGMTTYRTGDFYDVIANTIGIILASLLFNKLINWFDTI